MKTYDIKLVSKGEIRPQTDQSGYWCHTEDAQKELDELQAQLDEVVNRCQEIIRKSNRREDVVIWIQDAITGDNSRKVSDSDALGVKKR